MGVVDSQDFGEQCADLCSVGAVGALGGCLFSMVNNVVWLRAFVLGYF